MQPRSVRRTSVALIATVFLVAAFITSVHTEKSDEERIAEFIKEEHEWELENPQVKYNQEEDSNDITDVDESANQDTEGEEGAMQNLVMALNAKQDEEAAFRSSIGDSDEEPDKETEAEQRYQSLKEILDVDSKLVKELEEEAKKKKRRKRALLPNDDSRWDRGIVPYVMKDSVTSPKLVYEAMHQYERSTCIRFYEWKDNNTNIELGLSHPGHLNFVKDGGCWADMGLRRHSTTGQTISCCGGLTCIHELGHAFGAYHEHSSPLAKGLLRMNPQHAEKRYQGAFEIAPDDAFFTGFDPQSVMMYGPWLWSKDGKKTSTKENSDMLRTTDDCYYLFQEVSMAHKCGETYCGDFNMVCVNDGYVTQVDGECRCVCPPGLDPDNGCASIQKTTSPSVSFPLGKYGLPAPAAGCPPGFGGGARLQKGKSVGCKNKRADNECDWFAANGMCKSYKVYMELFCAKACKTCTAGVTNYMSERYDMQGKADADGHHHGFCMMDQPQGDIDDKFLWPYGRYCVFRSGGSCPAGFNEGSAEFTDSGSGSTKSGSVPDGDFWKKKTKFQYCCRNDPFQSPIKWPTSDPLALLMYRGHCAPIEGMRVSKQYMIYPNDGVANLTGWTPVKKYHGLGKENQYMIEYCYYEATDRDCGEIIDVTPENPVVTISSPNRRNLECNWVFRAPKDTHMVLNFNSFKIESNGGDDCSDVVHLRYNRLAETPVTYKKCRDSFNKTILTIGNDLVIGYDTAVSGSSSFEATVSLVYQDNMCYNFGDRGSSYRGKVNFTKSYKPCVPWTKATNCKHNSFQHGDVRDDLKENYCRNPDTEFGLQPWCYTDLDGCERDYCDVCLIDNIYDKELNCAELADNGVCDNPEEAITKCAKTCKSTVVPFSKPPPVKTISCGPPSDVDDGVLLGGPKKDSYNVGDVIGYRCDKDTVDDDRVWETRTCLTTGEWSVLNFVCDVCHSDWEYFDGKCYKYHPKRVYYEVAEAVCEKQGCVVAMAKTKEINDFFHLVYKKEYFWLGGGDAETEGTFKWNDGTAMDFTNWDKDQPDNYYNEDCMNVAKDGKWSDQHCHRFYKYSFICEHAAFEEGTCDDVADTCLYLQEQDPEVCDSQKDFMSVNCKKTCGLCVGVER